MAIKLILSDFFLIFLLLIRKNEEWTLGLTMPDIRNYILTKH